MRGLQYADPRAFTLLRGLPVIAALVVLIFLSAPTNCPDPSDPYAADAFDSCIYVVY